MQSKQNLNFLSKGIDLSRLGFKLQDKKVYQSLISPFAQDQQGPHPFKMQIPDSFKSFEFPFEKIDKKNILDQTLIYIFYNVLDQKMQFFAAQTLITDRKQKLLKKGKIWVKQTEKGPVSFNIMTWKQQEFKQNTKDSDFYTLKQIIESKQ